MPVRAKHWETDDGRKFDDRKAATRHERWLELVDLAHALRIPANNEDDECLARTLLREGPELRRILRANPVEGRAGKGGAS